MSSERGGVDWRTPAEVCEYRETPGYAETIAYLERLAAAFPDQVRIEEFGRSGEGRDLKVVIVSRDGVFDPESARSMGRVILLVQNSIHAGEMDGKDACLALLRDLLTDPKAASLLRRVVWLFVPVYNVDGHERRSAYHRINQNGPREVGWRANATNLNLNRDYLKSDAPETRAFLRLFRRWVPDFFVDDHVTDGADFQYDVTFALDSTPDVAPATAAWVRDTAVPWLERGVHDAGHLAFPAAVFLRDDTDPSRGLRFNPNPPRFSTGYMILEGRPGLLVELHMLKEYRTRVEGNAALLRSLLELLERDATKLIELNRAADDMAIRIGSAGPGAPELPLALIGSGATTPVRFRGYRFLRAPSPGSGSVAVRYTRDPWDAMLPVETGVQVSASVRPPAGYIIPPQWERVIDVLEIHGVKLERTSREWTGPVGRYRCAGMVWPARPFEGRHPILPGGPVESEIGHFGECLLSDEPATFPSGSVVVSLHQRLARVVVHWLEPVAPDSALRWGFFAPIFEQKERGEGYVLERLAEEELSREPGLRAEFERRVRADERFARDPAARLDFFYDRSPWGRANRVGEYPVGRLPTLEGLPLVPHGSPDRAA